MTLQEAKDHVAIDMFNLKFNQLHIYQSQINVLEKAAELYARSKWDEACISQRQICWSQLDYQVNQNKVAKSPLAVFEAWG